MVEYYISNQSIGYVVMRCATGEEIHQGDAPEGNKGKPGTAGLPYRRLHRRLLCSQAHGNIKTQYHLDEVTYSLVYGASVTGVNYERSKTNKTTRQ